MPVPPNQRRKTASVMTRPSGETDAERVQRETRLAFPGVGVLRVTGMPQGGVVRFNGRELVGIRWADDAMTMYDLNAGDMSNVSDLRITDANGVSYQIPSSRVVPRPQSGGNSYHVNFSDGVRQAPLFVGVNLGTGIGASTPRANTTSRSFTDVGGTINIGGPGGGVPIVLGLPTGIGSGIGGLITGARSGPGDIFSITGVPATVTSLRVKENERILTGTLASGTWTASDFDVSDAAILTVTPTVRGTGEGFLSADSVARPLTRTVAIPVTGLTVGYSSLTLVARPSYTDVTNTPPAMTGIVLVGDINSIGGATFSLDGVAVAYAPGAAQWLPTTPAYTRLFIPATAGARVVRLIKGGRTLMASATVAANMVSDVPVTGMVVETTQQVTDTAPPPVTGIVLVGDITSIGGATFSLDGVAVAYAPGAAQWLPTTPAYTRLFIPATAGARVVRLIKGGSTLIANATVAANLVTDIPVAEMQQELIEMPKAEDKKDKLPAVVPQDKLPAVVTTQLEPGNVRPPPPPEMYPPQARLPPVTQPTPTPGMSMTSKLIIGGLVAAALGGGYWYYKKSA